MQTRISVIKKKKKKKSNPGLVEVLTGLGLICVPGHACVQTRTGVIKLKKKRKKKKKKKKKKKNPGHAEVLIGLCVIFGHGALTRQDWQEPMCTYIYISWTRWNGDGFTCYLRPWTRLRTDKTQCHFCSGHAQWLGLLTGIGAIVSWQMHTAKDSWSRLKAVSRALRLGRLLFFCVLG